MREAYGPLFSLIQQHVNFFAGTA